jgi:CO/xanthine dehydrogenase FAD-binding subunit
VDLNTITDVVRLGGHDALPSWQDGDAWLSGGTWLFSEPQPHLRRLIDLTGLKWPAIEIDSLGLRIAATCTIAQLDGQSLPAEWSAAPLVGQCCRAFVASFKIWNTATVGGNICMALPAGPMISLVCALDGIAVIWSPDGAVRRMPVLDFVTGARKTALAPDQVLREIVVPVPALTRRVAFRQTSLTQFGRSAALLIGTMAPNGGAFDLTITAATARPVRLSFASIPDGQELARLIAREVPDSLYYDDVHGAPEWRKHLTFELAEDIRRELSGASSS